MSKTETVMDLIYIKQLRCCLNAVGCWPRKETGQKPIKYLSVYSVILVLFAIFMIIDGFWYIKNNIQNMDIFEIGHTYMTTFMSCSAGYRLTLPFQKKYKRMTETFIKQFHLLHFKDKSDYSMKIYKKIDKLSRYITMYFNFLPWLAVLGFQLQPLYYNYVNGLYSSNRPENTTFKHTVYYVLPFDYETNVYGYICIYLFNLYASCVSAVCFAYVDLYMLLLIFNILGHLKILLHNLQQFPKPQESDSVVDTIMFSNEEMENIFELLKESINHHRIIMDFVSLTSEALSALLCIYYGFYQIILFMVLLLCSQLDINAIVNYSIVALFFFQELILTSMIFELLGTTSDKVKAAVYELPWECMDTKNRKIVLFFLKKAQEPIELKALGILPVGVNTMAAIIKNSISYFLMLRATV
uniref:Odorant receptor n=1 Tax=Eogystia hippophaecolus TaxID=1206364 RepID=A0A1B3P5Q6_EOGHI|nr:odorant receptor [Eogystia hippophaecolus]